MAKRLILVIASVLLLGIIGCAQASTPEPLQPTPIPAPTPTPAPPPTPPPAEVTISDSAEVTISDSALETALRDALDKPEGPIYKSDLESLITLDLAYNNISDISALSGLTNLVELGLQENNIGDISALSGLTNLERLYLYDNPLSQNAINIHIPELEARGVSVTR